MKPTLHHTATYYGPDYRRRAFWQWKEGNTDASVTPRQKVRFRNGLRYDCRCIEYISCGIYHPAARFRQRVKGIPSVGGSVQPYAARRNEVQHSATRTDAVPRWRWRQFSKGNASAPA